MADRLYRSREDRMLAGVAAGVADALDADPSIVRIVWALLAIFTGGIALVVYVVMAIVVPEAPAGVTSPWGPSAGAPMPPSDAASSDQPAIQTLRDDHEARREARRARRASGEPARGSLIAGVVLILIGGFFLIRAFVPWFDWTLWWPIGVMGLGVLLLVLALTPRRPAG